MSVKGKRTKKKRTKTKRALWPSDSEDDDDFDNDSDFGDYDEVPNLYMADPRDREIAEILYGPGAAFCPEFFSDT